jgi:hypothetical protein
VLCALASLSDPAVARPFSDDCMVSTCLSPKWLFVIDASVSIARLLGPPWAASETSDRVADPMDVTLGIVGSPPGRRMPFMRLVARNGINSPIVDEVFWVLDAALLGPRSSGS